MKQRKLSLPTLGVKTFWALTGALLLICLCAGIAMRLSITDYNSNMQTIGELPYVLQNKARETSLVLDADETMVAPLDSAPLIVTAEFTGEREYVFRSFQCTMRVTSVIRGDGVSVGDNIVVYDSYEICEPNGYEGARLSSNREVRAVGDGASLFGLTPLRDGQEYLLFLEKKLYPETLDKGSYTQTYCMISSPYARISIDCADNPNRIGVVPDVDGQASGAMTDYARIPFSEACKYDIFVYDDSAKNTYYMNSELIVSAYVDSGGV